MSHVDLLEPGEAITAGESGDPDQAFSELARRHRELRAELASVEARMRDLLTLSDICERCGGVGRRQVRGGLYGERQERACTCRI